MDNSPNQQDIDAFNKAMGTQLTPASVGGGSSSFSDKILQAGTLGKQSAPRSLTRELGSEASGMAGAVGNYFKGVGDSEIENLKGFGDIHNKAIETIGKQDNSTFMGGLKSAAQDTGILLGTAGQAVKTIFQPITTGITQIVQHLADKISNDPTVQKIAQSDGVSAALDALDVGGQKYSDWAKENPNLSQGIEGGVTTALGLAGAEGLDEPLSKIAGDTLKSISSKLPDGGIPGQVAPGAGSLEEALVNGPKGSVIKDTISNVKGKVTGALPKVMSDIDLANVPPQDIPKLSDEQFQRLYKNKLDVASNEGKDALKLAKAEYEQATAQRQAFQEAAQKASDARIEDLQTNLKDTAFRSSEKAQEDVTKVFTEKSQEFGKLQDQALENARTGSPTMESKVSDLIDKHSETPEIAAEIKSKLGIKPQSDAPGEINMNFPDKPLDPQKVVDLAKQYRAEQSRPGVRGTATFTPNDIVINQKLDALGNILQDMGVDMSKPNTMWSEWKPTQRDIMSKISPFKGGDFSAQTFADMLEKNGRGTADVSTKNFVKTIEDLTGKSVSKDVNEAVSKLSDAEKRTVIKQFDDAQETIDKIFEEKQNKIKSDTQSNKGKIESEKSIQNQLKEKRAFNLKVIKYLLSVGGIGLTEEAIRRLI